MSFTVRLPLGYLDPGSGSMILQLLAGGAAAVAVGGKLFWRRILGFFGLRRDDGRHESRGD
ncbi:MAG: hypothetical protein ACRDON_01410 [Gaiellaceae bacterium]